MVVAVLLRMDQQIEQLTAKVAAQDERIAKLEQQAKRSSRNSSQPPSVDPPNTPPQPRSPTGRKQGAQAGHEGRGRSLLPGLRNPAAWTAPAEVTASALGSRLQAAIVTLSVRNRISRRDVVELCEQLFSARILDGHR